MNCDLKYTEKNGLFYPLIQISKNPADDEPLGFYGRMALKYLYENSPARYTELLMEGTLMEKMHEVERKAHEMVERIIRQLLDRNPMPKTDDILEHTRHLNGMKLIAEEIVLSDVIYSAI